MGCQNREIGLLVYTVQFELGSDADFVDIFRLFGVDYIVEDMPEEYSMILREFVLLYAKKLKFWIG